jgi:hypothetical protein
MERDGPGTLLLDFADGWGDFGLRVEKLAHPKPLAFSSHCVVFFTSLGGLVRFLDFVPLDCTPLFA